MVSSPQRKVPAPRDGGCGSGEEGFPGSRPEMANSDIELLHAGGGMVTTGKPPIKPVQFTRRMLAVRDDIPPLALRRRRR